MPRNEGFLDPGAGPLASFAWDLRALREKSGKVPYRVLAKRAGFCASTLSVAASGTRLPSLDVTLAYVQACGGDPEPWRARWNELSELHAPVPEPTPEHSDPIAQPGLHVAAPYDADELGEPARLEIPAAARAAAVVDGPSAVVAVVTREDARPDAVPLPRSETRLEGRLETHPTTASRRATTAGASWWRSRLSVGRVATVALTLATAILSLKVVIPDGGSTAEAGPPAASASSSGTPMQQADALYTVIYQFTPIRSDTNDAIWDVGSCRDLSNAQSKLRGIARKRQEQVEQLAALDVSKIPDSVELSAALKHAWLTSAQSDTAYANIAADLQTGCTSGAVATDPNYQQADAYAQAANSAMAEAARLWNSNADELGQLRISEREL